MFFVVTISGRIPHISNFSNSRCQLIFRLAGQRTSSEAGQIAFAISVARELLRIVPSSISGRLLLAGALVRGGGLAEAQAIGRDVMTSEPAFSSSRYAGALPYRDETTREGIAADLSRAGLPD